MSFYIAVVMFLQIVKFKLKKEILKLYYLKTQILYELLVPAAAVPYYIQWA